MKKIYVLLGCILLFQLSNNLSAQVIFSEDFSSATGTTPPTGWINNDIQGGGEVWAFDNPGGQTLNVPLSDPTAIFDSDFNGSGSGPEDAALESPVFDASVVTGYIMLSFDHTFFDDSQFGGTGAQYFVEVWNGTTWVQVLSGTDDTQDPEHVSLNVTAAANGAATAQVRFRWTGDWGYWWMIDNVVVEEISCAPVFDLYVEAATPSSLDITWTAGGAETNWNIEYGPTGFTPGSGTLGTATGTPGFSVGSLTANTSYDFYVQADCGAGDESTWLGPITGYTGFCDFGGIDSDYFIDNFSTTGGSTNISNLGSGFATNGYEDATAMTVSQFAGGPNIDFTVEFGFSDYFGFGIWVDWNNNMIFEASEKMFTSPYTDQIFTGSFGVPMGTPVGNYRMRILADYDNGSPDNPCSTDYGYGEVEDYTFEVTPTPTCLPIDNLSFEGATANSIDISWTAGGSETDWNIEYGPSGFTPGSGTLGTATGTPYFTAPSLTANTEYEFYVQADCGGGDESPWTGPITGYTGYCDFETFQPDYYINNFSTTGGATSNISNLSSGFSTNGYEDASAMTVSQFEGGPDVNFSVDFGLPGYTFGFGIWVDWNDNMVFESSEQMFQSFNYEDNFSGSFGVPIGTAVGSYRMRILADYWNFSPTDACTTNSGEGEVEDYTFVVVPIPSCLPVTDLNVDNEMTNSIDISWTPGGSETAWNIEWGTPGFVPGTGAGLDSAQQTSTASFTVSGLNSSSNYDIYVQASCSSTDSSYWTLVSGTTLCAPITSLPWTEDFEAMTDFDYSLFPLCWLNETGDWLSDNSNNTPGVANSGSNFVGIYNGSNDHLWTPEFQLIAGKNYEFSFMWTSVDNFTGWAGSVVVNNTQSSSGATPLGSPFIAPTDQPNDDYGREFFCFTPTTSGVYTFGIKVSASFNPYFLAFDDFSLVERAATAGTGGTIDACQIEGLVDLNALATINDPMGSWTFSPNPTTIVNDSMFNPEFVPAGTVSVDYVTYGCLVDTASVLVTIYPPSSAGIDGAIVACKNEPVDLLSGLNGTVNMGGDWYDPNNNPMPSSQVITGTFPGQYNYDYISGNGVCPDDTAGVVVTVTNCDWLSVDENAFETVNLYPNPSTGLVYIESSMTTASFKLEITDVNGRIIETGSNSITNGVNTVNLNSVQRGTYFFKLSSEQAEKVYRVVIQ